MRDREAWRAKSMVYKSSMTGPLSNTTTSENTQSKSRKRRMVPCESVYRQPRPMKGKLIWEGAPLDSFRFFIICLYVRQHGFIQNKYVSTLLRKSIGFKKITDHLNTTAKYSQIFTQLGKNYKENRNTVNSLPQTLEDRASSFEADTGEQFVNTGSVILIRSFIYTNSLFLSWSPGWLRLAVKCGPIN